MFINKLNVEVARLVALGRTVGTVEADLEGYINEAICHEKNRDHETNATKHPHHVLCEYCPSKLNVTMHYFPRDGVSIWRVGSGNTRLCSMKNKGIENLDPAFFVNPLQVTIQIHPHEDSSARSLKNAGGPGVGWSSSDLDKIDKKLADILPGNTIFEEFGMKSTFSSSEKKNMEATYSSWAPYLVPVFKKLSTMSNQGIDIKGKDRRARNAEATINNVAVFQAGVVKGFAEALKEGVPEALVMSAMEKVAVRDTENPMTMPVLGLLLTQYVNSKQGGNKQSELATSVRETLKLLHSVNFQPS